MENDTFEQALEKVLMPLGLVYAKRGDKYIVSTGPPIRLCFRKSLIGFSIYLKIIQPYRSLDCCPRDTNLTIKCRTIET